MHPAAHELLDLGGRDPQPGGVVGPIFRDQRAGDIVAVARALLDGIARHPIAVAIKQHASEEARLASFSINVALPGGVAGELGLDRLPQRLIDDRLMFARIGLFVVNDLTAIDAVLQHQVERTGGNGLPPEMRPEALVRNLLWVLRACSASFSNRTEPSSA